MTTACDDRTDAELVAAIAASSDALAFRQLFCRFAPRLKAYFIRCGRDASESEDLVQEAMLTLFRDAGNYRSERAAVSTWLFSLARNRHIDALRRNRVLAAEYSSFDSDCMEPDELLASRELAERLLRHIDELPMEQAAVVRGAYFSSETSAELSSRLHVPSGTVKSRLRLAIRFLQQRLSGERT